jgi:hypothetical protein
VPYDQIVVFLEEIHPTPAPRCRVSIALDPSSPPGSKLRFSGLAISADPGHIAGRVGEVRRSSGGGALRLAWTALPCPSIASRLLTHPRTPTPPRPAPPHPFPPTGEVHELAQRRRLGRLIAPRPRCRAAVTAARALRGGPAAARAPDGRGARPPARRPAAPRPHRARGRRGCSPFHNS